MIRGSSLVLAGMLAACGGGADSAAEATNRAGGASSAQESAQEETWRGRGDALFSMFAGAWAIPGGCGDPVREWRIEAKGFHASHLNCDVLFAEQAEEGVRAVADCLINGFSDGAEDSFLFLATSAGDLSILDETVGSWTVGLERCDAGESRDAR